MKAKIDEGMCTGCNACVETCPEVFELNADNICKVKVETVSDELKEKVRDASSACPVTCIEVTE